MELPIAFKQRMAELLGEEYPDYLQSFEEERLHGLRVNTLKVSVNDFLEKSPFSLEQVDFIPTGFYYEEDVRPSKQAQYAAGLYYLQEPSAMLPAHILPVKPGDWILDLCAAPGGKSTQLAAKLQQQGLLVSNDISPSRCKGLLKNIEISGIRNSLVTSEAPEKLVKYFKESFDGVLVDAPCSGEGMFRKDPEMLKHWTEETPHKYHELQKEIVMRAVEMLKPGGYMVYSTCTFSIEENEQTLKYLLDKCPEMQLCEMPKFEGFGNGLIYASEAPEELLKTTRLWPHKIKGEGHFVALLQKMSLPETEQLSGLREMNNGKMSSSPVSEYVYQAYRDFESKYTYLNLDKQQLFFNNEQLYYLPLGLPSFKGLRALRTGWYLGDVTKNQFEPSQAFASGLEKSSFVQTLTLTPEDPNVLRYLKGETLMLEAPKGYILVCVEDFPLGFAKSDGRLLKNKYYKGWRWMS